MPTAAAPRVLVTGATGFVGRRLVQRLVGAGRPVMAASRAASPDLPEGAERSVIADVSAATDWTRALQETDLVVHCAAHIPLGSAAGPAVERRCQEVNVEGTAALAAQAARAGVRRFIYLSSVKVHGESTPADRPFTEESALAPADAYGRSKRDAEAALFAASMGSAMEVVILRPPLVYGPDAKGNLAAMLAWVRRGRPLPFGAVRANRRSLLGIENLVDAILRCAEHTAAAGQTFVVSDGEDVSTAELLRRLGRAVGRPARLLSVPPAFLAAGASLLGQSAASTRLLGSLRVDATKLRNALQWTPPLSLDEGLRLMALRTP